MSCPPPDRDQSEEGGSSSTTQDTTFGTLWMTARQFRSREGPRCGPRLDVSRKQREAYTPRQARQDGEARGRPHRTCLRLPSPPPRPPLPDGHSTAANHSTGSIPANHGQMRAPWTSILGRARGQCGSRPKISQGRRLLWIRNTDLKSTRYYRRKGAGQAREGAKPVALAPSCLSRSSAGRHGIAHTEKTTTVEPS